MQISVLPLGELQTNCYIVMDEAAKSAAVVDPGADGARVAALLREDGYTLKLILLTHGHYDHVGGVRALHELTGAPVYLNERDLTLPESFTAGPLFYTNAYDEGDRVVMDDLTFRVLATPGHTPGSVCLLCGDAMLSGDTLFQGSCGRTDLPGGDPAQMFRSLRRLAELEESFFVLPGHGNGTTLDEERAGNFYLQEALRR